MPHKELIIGFALTLTLIVLCVGLILFSVLFYAKKRVADDLAIRQLADHYEKELLKSQLEVQEQTFEHVSRELHDSIGSAISIAKAFNISVIQDVDRVRYVDDLLGKVLEDIRQLSKGLGLEVIRTDGLARAVDGVIEQLRKLNRFEVQYEMTGTYDLLDEQIEIIVFRILQESINNIIRHAQATRVNVSLNFKAEKMCLDIQDDGLGFRTTGSATPGGLLNMRTRAALINGTLTIESKESKGTRIKLCIPLKSQ